MEELFLEKKDECEKNDSNVCGYTYSGGNEHGCAGGYVCVLAIG
jgi:hypothetical protein